MAADTNSRSEPNRPTTRWIVAGALGLGLVLFIVWANMPAAVPITSAWIHQQHENVLEVEVGTCHGHLSVSTDENEDEVRIVVRDNRFRIRLYGDDCADIVQVELDQAPGGRALIDETTGREIRVRTDF